MAGVDAVALMLRPIARGWAVTFTDGRELVRFTGPFAKYRAVRFIAGRSGEHTNAA